MNCKCGHTLENNENIYNYFQNIDKKSLTIIPDAASNTVKVRENSQNEEISLHTCQVEDFEQLCAIRNLDPTSYITLIGGANAVTLYANYEKWNYVIKCVILEKC